MPIKDAQIHSNTNANMERRAKNTFLSSGVSTMCDFSDFMHQKPEPALIAASAISMAAIGVQILH
jgi:hypothetical protein